jgi:hypothetical protein
MSCSSPQILRAWLKNGTAVTANDDLDLLGGNGVDTFNELKVKNAPLARLRVGLAYSVAARLKALITDPYGTTSTVYVTDTVVADQLGIYDFQMPGFAFREGTNPNVEWTVKFQWDTNGTSRFFAVSQLPD